MIYLSKNLRIPKTILRVADEPQLIFGQLIKFGQGHGMPTSFLGDLYYDAIWLEEHWKALLVDGYFYFGLRYTGTSIGQEMEYISPYNIHVALCLLPTVASESVEDIERRSKVCPESAGRELMTKG